MADTRKQNWRAQMADNRWRKKVLWATACPRERAIIKAELRRDKISLEMSGLWDELYKRGYEKMTNEERGDAFSRELDLILELMREFERTGKRIDRFEKATGKDVEELVKRHRMANVKSVCF